MESVYQKPGICFTCGFLASQEHSGQNHRQNIYEMDDFVRRYSDSSNLHIPLSGKAINTRPICFRFVAQLSAEIYQSTKNGNTDKEACQEVFLKERNCKYWYRYIPGLDPKEHYQKLDMELLERSRREFEERLERDRKEFDLKLFKISQDIQKDSAKIASRNFWSSLIFTLIIIALTLVQIALALRTWSGISLWKYFGRLFMPQ